MATTKKGLGGTPLQRREPKATRTSSLVSAMRSSDDVGVLTLELDAIADNPENPAARVEDVVELAESMREVGQLQPGLVVAARDYLEQYPQHAETVGERSWVLLAGHRRRAAAQAAGLTSFQALRRDASRLDETVLHENVHRKALTPLEEAQAYARVMERQGLGQRMMAKHAGVSQSHVAKRLSLLKLPTQLQQAVAEGVLSTAAAVEFVAQESAETLEELAHQWANLDHSTSWERSPSDLLTRARNIATKRARVAAAQAKAEAEGVEFLEDPSAAIGPRKEYEHVLHTPEDIEAARERGDLAYAPRAAYGDDEPVAYRLSAPEPQERVVSEWEAKQRAREQARNAATKQRRAFLAETVTRKPSTPEVTRLLTMTALAGESMLSHVTGLARKLAQGAGVGPDQETDWDWRAALDGVDKASTREHLAWIITLAIWEDRTKNGVYTRAPQGVITYLDHLVGRGYVLSEHEQSLVDAARKPQQGETSETAGDAVERGDDTDNETTEGEQA